MMNANTAPPASALTPAEEAAIRAASDRLARDLAVLQPWELPALSLYRFAERAEG